MFEMSHSPSKPNALSRWFNKFMSKTSSSSGEMVRHHEHGGGALRSGGEGVLTGAGLAVVHANAPTGLDVNIKKADPATGKGAINLPVDAAVAVAGLALGGPDAHNIGTAAAGVFSFRKTMDLMAEKKAQTGQKPKGTVGQVTAGGGAHGEFGEDPILVAARGLPNR